MDKPASLPTLLDHLNSALVLHMGAFRAVDRAEQQADLGLGANRDATAALAEWCAKHDRPLLHVSTDFVFSGEPPPGPPRSLLQQHGSEPEDPPSPLNVYRASKLAGEEAVRGQVTSWLFGYRHSSPGGSRAVSWCRVRPGRTTHLRPGVGRLVAIGQSLQWCFTGARRNVRRGWNRYQELARPSPGHSGTRRLACPRARR